MFCKYVLATTLFFVCVGCGGVGDDPVTVTAPTPADAIKTVLNGIIESGEPLGSGGQVIQEQLDAMATTDPDKKAKLQPLYDEIITMNNKTKLKAKAQEMLDLL